MRKRVDSGEVRIGSKIAEGEDDPNNRMVQKLAVEPLYPRQSGKYRVPVEVPPKNLSRLEWSTIELKNQ